MATSNAEHDAGRRRFLKWGGGIIAGLALAPNLASASILRSPSAVRTLNLYNLHTGEEIETVFWEHDRFVPDALADINYVLRDHRTDEIAPIDRDLLTLLYDLRGKVCTRKPFQVISGYRSPATNAMLRKHSRGVAKHSLHMQGKAIDIRVPGCDLLHLHRAAIELHRGGVGLYRRSNFIHVDVGRVRTWG